MSEGNQNPSDDLERRVNSEKIIPLLGKEYPMMLLRDTRRIFLLDDKGEVIGASDRAYGALGYDKLRELETCRITSSKKALDRWIEHNRKHGKMDSIQLNKLIMPTFNGEELTLYDPIINVYQNVTTIEISGAKKRELKDSKANIYDFRAPAYLDNVGSVGKRFKQKDHFIRDLIACNSNRKDEDIIVINMKDVEAIDETTLYFFNNVLLKSDMGLKLRKPHDKIYEQLIASGFPKENVLDYAEPRVKLLPAADAAGISLD